MKSDCFCICFKRLDFWFQTQTAIFQFPPIFIIDLTKLYVVDASMKQVFKKISSTPSQSTLCLGTVKSPRG